MNWNSKHLISQDWDDDIYLVYNIFTTIIQFIIPLSGIIFLYTKICMFVSSNTNLEYLSEARRIARMKRMNRTNKMLIAVSLLFLVSLLPLHLFTFSLNFIQLEVKMIFATIQNKVFFCNLVFITIWHPYFLGSILYISSDSHDISNLKSNYVWSSQLFISKGI